MSEEHAIPEHLGTNSPKKVQWKCHSSGQRWWDILTDHMNERVISPDPDGRPFPPKNDLDMSHPSLAAEWNYVSNSKLGPEQFTTPSSKKVQWICLNCGQSWQASIL